MKTKMLKVVCICLITLASTSCSKNNDCDPEDEDSPCYAGPFGNSKQLLIEEKTNGKTEMRFEYNDRNLVSVRFVHGVDGNVTREDFTYNGDIPIKVERRSNGQLVMSEEYLYDNSKKPTSAIQKNNKGENLSNIRYTYSGNNVTEALFDREGKSIGVNTYTFDNTGKNIIKQVLNLQNISLVTIEYSDYDEKPCRYTNYPWAWKVGSVNNARSQSLTSQVEGGVVATRNDRWKYTYNASGYPVKAEVYDKKTDALIEIREFTYRPAK